MVEFGILDDVFFSHKKVYCMTPCIGRQKWNLSIESEIPKELVFMHIRGIVGMTECYNCVVE